MCTEQMEPFPALQLVMFKRWSSDEPPQLELSTGMRNLALHETRATEVFR